MQHLNSTLFPTGLINILLIKGDAISAGYSNFADKTPAIVTMTT
jgi:hypothetical protein